MNRRVEWMLSPESILYRYIVMNDISLCMFQETKAVLKRNRSLIYRCRGFSEIPGKRRRCYVRGGMCTEISPIYQLSFLESSYVLFQIVKVGDCLIFNVYLSSYSRAHKLKNMWILIRAKSIS